MLQRPGQHARQAAAWSGCQRSAPLLGTRAEAVASLVEEGLRSTLFVKLCLAHAGLPQVLLAGGGSGQLKRSIRGLRFDKD